MQEEGEQEEGALQEKHHNICIPPKQNETQRGEPLDGE